MKIKDTNINDLMEAKGLKYYIDLGREIGYTSQQMNYNFKKANITIKQLERLSAHWNIPVVDLIKSDYVAKK